MALRRGRPQTRGITGLPHTRMRRLSACSIQSAQFLDREVGCIYGGAGRDRSLNRKAPTWSARRCGGAARSRATSASEDPARQHMRTLELDRLGRDLRHPVKPGWTDMRTRGVLDRTLWAAGADHKNASSSTQRLRLAPGGAEGPGRASGMRGLATAAGRYNGTFSDSL